MNTILSRDKNHLDLAIKLARKFQHDGRFYFASLLVHRGSVINVGKNWMRKSHPKSNHPHKFIHSELDVIIGVDYNKLVGSTMFVARVGGPQKSSLLMAKPCCWCQELVGRSGIKDVYYTINDGTIGCWNVKANCDTILSLT